MDQPMYVFVFPLIIFGALVLNYCIGRRVGKSMICSSLMNVGADSVSPFER